jgi:hypothetical protein
MLLKSTFFTLTNMKGKGGFFLFCRGLSLLDMLFLDMSPQGVLALGFQFILANNLAHIANRRELDGVDGTNHCAGGTARHTGLWRGDNGFVGYLIEGVDILTTGCDTQPLANATISMDLGMPDDIPAWNSVPDGFRCIGHFDLQNNESSSSVRRQGVGKN